MSEKIQVNEYSAEERAALTRGVMNILDQWGLNAAQTVAVLDLPEKTPTRMLRRYRDNTPFPDTEEVNERISHILGIADALRTSWPHNPAMGMLWMKQRNKRFQSRAPIQHIVVDGLPGIIDVRSHLDCTYSWFDD